MSVLTDIINLLADDSKPLSMSLLKLKILATRLKNREMVDWLEKEIGGYNKIDEQNIPSYRHFECTLVGSFLNGNMKYSNQPILTSGLNEKAKHIATHTCFYHGMGALESMEKQNTIELSVPSELKPLVDSYYQGLGNPYFQLYSLSRCLDGTAPQQIISNVRNLSLNLVLELEKEFGIDIDLKDLLKKETLANKVIYQQIMKQNIIKTRGDANLINIGDANKINQDVEIKISNFEELTRFLKEKGIEDSDIKDLKDVIDLNPTPSPDNQTLNNQVQVWIRNMMNKCINGTWEVGKQIGVASAANLLSQAIMMYYGFT